MSKITIWQDQKVSINYTIFIIFIILGVIINLIASIPLIFLFWLGKFNFYLLIENLIVWIILIFLVSLYIFLKNQKPIEISNNGIKFSKIFSRHTVTKDEIKSITIGKTIYINKLMRLLLIAECFNSKTNFFDNKMHDSYLMKIETENNTFWPRVVDITGLIDNLNRLDIKVNKGPNNIYYFNNNINNQ